MLEMSDRLPGLGSLEVGLLAAVLPQLLNGLGFQARRALPFFRSKRFFRRQKTFAGAIDWLKCNEGADNYMLWVRDSCPNMPDISLICRASHDPGFFQAR